MKPSEVNGFVREGLQMKSFKHTNVMELIGICWSSDPMHSWHVSPLIVLPYMELGDLNTHLRRCRPGRRLTLRTLPEPRESEPLTPVCVVMLWLLYICIHVVCVVNFNIRPAAGEVCPSNSSRHGVYFRQRSYPP